MRLSALLGRDWTRISVCLPPPAAALQSITMGDAATFYPIGRLGLQCMSGGYPQARASRADSLVILAQNLLVASAAHGKKCSFPTPACGSNAIGLMRDLRFLRDLFFSFFFFSGGGCRGSYGI